MARCHPPRFARAEMLAEPSQTAAAFAYERSASSADFVSPMDYFAKFVALSRSRIDVASSRKSLSQSLTL